MLGTNDLWSSLTPDQIVVNMGAIAKYLTDNGVERVIVNQVPYAESHNASKAVEYNSKLAKLVDGNKILLGDTQMYDWSKAQFAKDPMSIYSDGGTHFNTVGYKQLGQFWAEAYKRVLLDPQTTKHVVTANGDMVSYAISKDGSWFKPEAGYFSNVLVDNQIIDAADYTVTGDNNNTKIVLNADYVKALDKTAKHTISVRFNDGVNFSDEFELKAGDNAGNNNQGDSGDSGNQNQASGNHQNAGVARPTAVDKVTIAAPNTGYRK